MTWTYDNDPQLTGTAAQLRDAVRLYLGDTDTNDQLLTDEEIAFALDQKSDSTTQAAVLGAGWISANFSRLADISTPDVKIAYSTRASSYRELKQELESAVVGKTPIVFAGGTSIDDKRDAELDADRVKPAFTVGMHDYPGIETGVDPDLASGT